MAPIEGLTATADFRVLFESAPGLYLVLDPELTIVGVSDAYLRATMTRRENILGRGLFEVFPDNPDDLAATGESNLRASLSRVLRARVPDAMAVQKYDIRRPESEGGAFEERFWSPLNSPVFGPEGSLRYIIHQVEDVTEFARLKRLGTEQTRLNEELQTRAGQMDAEIYRRAQQLQLANEQLRKTEEALRTVNETLEQRVAERTRALQTQIDERQVLEEQFRQAQKMEAMGQLAGGVAHDFNNILTAILVFSRFVQNDLGPQHPSQEDLREITRSAERAAALTRQLLAFSRKQVLDLKVLDLNTVILQCEKMFRRLMGEDIAVSTLLSPGLGKVKADHGHLEQVLMNLLVNARDALPQGGKITIETGNVVLDEDYAHGHIGAKAGRYVMLAVSDDGVGIDAVNQARIFQPFFTTKEVGRGTGLGLAMVHGVVKQTGGEVFVYSTPGKGTTFKIYLPLVVGADASDALAAPQPAVGGHETVLLVEDEDVVHKGAERVLKQAGYRVLGARNPEAAMKVFEASEGTIDLLISDVVMPGMDGPSLAKELVHRALDLKVLFVSGYTGGALVNHGVLSQGINYLQKPFTPDGLLAKVRAVLDVETTD